VSQGDGTEAASGEDGTAASADRSLLPTATQAALLGMLVCAACWREIRSAPRPNSPPASQTRASAPPVQREIAFDGQTPKAQPWGGVGVARALGD
jgi:hypothetical protein